jgi:crotonobetainyl-CoA:carnitine CoA-transferase CaiB-like acyl-CoA transferase
MPDQALSGLKVLEFANLVSGPYCGKMFADLGAEVIKIEDPVGGDTARNREPFAGNTPGLERSGLFAYLNTNKMSITLDPKTARGKSIFIELVKDADILIENHSPKEMEQLGFTYEALEKINPRLIMTSITPFGQTGPYRDYKAFELNTYQGSGYGFISTVCFEEPVPQPIKAGGRQSEFGTAQAAAVATMTAVHARDEIFAGQHIDIAIIELMAGQNESGIQHWVLAENEMGGVSHPVVQPICPLPCKDGHFFLMCVEDHQYDKFVDLMGNPEWNDSELFKDRFARADYVDALIPLLSEWTMEYTKQEIFKMGQAAHVPLAPAYTAEDVVNDGHLADRKYFEEIEHPVIGKAKYPGAPYRLSETPWQIKRHAPLLGEHNEEILVNRLGYTRQDIVKLSQAGVI